MKNNMEGGTFYSYSDGDQNRGECRRNGGSIHLFYPSK
jgi:hypothetical protein